MGAQPELSDEQKVTGREFKAKCVRRLVRLNSSKPVDHKTPHYLEVYRHLCGAKNDMSTGIMLKEFYWQDGLFAFVFKAGRCRHCKETARSVEGQFVLVASRPRRSWGRGRDMADIQVKG